MAAEDDFAAMSIPVCGEEVQSATGPVNAVFRHFDRGHDLSYSERALVTATLQARADMMRVELQPTLLEDRYLVTEKTKRRQTAKLAQARAETIEAVNAYLRDCRGVDVAYNGPPTCKEEEVDFELLHANRELVSFTGYKVQYTDECHRGCGRCDVKSHMISRAHIGCEYRNANGATLTIWRPVQGPPTAGRYPQIRPAVQTPLVLYCATDTTADPHHVHQQD